MTNQINTVSQTSPRSELDSTKIIPRGNCESDTKTVEKITGASAGIALFLATTILHNSANCKELKGKVAFGVCCATGSMMLYHMVKDGARCVDKYKQILAERRRYV